MPTEFRSFESKKNLLLHILFKCYCFCLLMLGTQIVQFVQLENLAFFLGSPQKYKPTETCYALIKMY
uniref:Macaca fascicularis brain cDNA clone: QflA-23688, similar to human Ras-GTPase activating protein SH3 domain-binding protein2 (G3BP2), transcript variant 2, mRNA, RefSeq: NM_012297.3 n=1 Tax=Macaca fascicularis TaxID=9541 RepID=I7GMU5_MACFA|nr:unnamed protein product [Macaca fascicularis]